MRGLCVHVATCARRKTKGDRYKTDRTSRVLYLPPFVFRRWPRHGQQRRRGASCLLCVEGLASEELGQRNLTGWAALWLTSRRTEHDEHPGAPQLDSAVLSRRPSRSLRRQRVM